MRRSATAYRALAGAALRSLLAYRLQFLLGLLGGVFVLLSLLYLWRTIIEGGLRPAGLTWPQMKLYLLVGFLANTVVSTYTDWRMASRIRDGAVAIDLTKPVDYQRARFAEATGFAVIELGAGIAVCGLALLVFGGVPLPSGATAAVFVVSLLLIVPLKFSVVYLSTLLCFWTQNYMGVSWARLALMSLFSGALIPIALFPGWLQAIADALPFQAMASTPALIALDRLHGRELWRHLAAQAGWTVGLWYAARAAWTTSSRRLTVHGG